MRLPRRRGAAALGGEQLCRVLDDPLAAGLAEHQRVTGEVFTLLELHPRVRRRHLRTGAGVGLEVDAGLVPLHREDPAQLRVALRLLPDTFEPRPGYARLEARAEHRVCLVVVARADVAAELRDLLHDGVSVGGGAGVLDALTGQLEGA